MQCVDQLGILQKSTKALTTMYCQNYFPVSLILEMCDRRSLQQGYSFQKYEEFYIITMRYEGTGSGESEGIVLISAVGLHFLQEYLSVQDHCTPKADPIFPFFFLWKKQLFTEVELLFMCSSQEGIRPHSRKY